MPVSDENSGREDAQPESSAPTPRTTNSAARASFILGICAILVSGLFGVVGTLAIIFGAIGLHRTREMGIGNARITARRRSIIGIVLGSISIGLTFAVVALIVALSQPHIDSALLQKDIMARPLLTSGIITEVDCPHDPSIVVGKTFSCTGYLAGGGTVSYTATITTAQGNVQWTAKVDP